MDFDVGLLTTLAICCCLANHEQFLLEFFSPTVHANNRVLEGEIILQVFMGTNVPESHKDSFWCPKNGVTEPSTLGVTDGNSSSSCCLL